MDRFFSQSTSSNYYHPRSRPHTLQKSSNTLITTPSQPYDFEQSLKLYEQLLTENLHLKNILFNQTHSNKSNPQPTKLNSTPKQFIQPSNPSLARNQSSKCLNSTGFNQSTCHASSHGSQSIHNSYKENDMAMWSIKHRNQYLQEKLHNLQNQYNRQQNTIAKVMNSEQWQNRLDCKESTCYQDKYIQLLRVKSPVLLE